MLILLFAQIRGDVKNLLLLLERVDIHFYDANYLFQKDFLNFPLLHLHNLLRFYDEHDVYKHIYVLIVTNRL